MAAPQAAAAAEPLPWPRRPVLRLGSHNTNGIITPQAAQLAAHEWMRAGFDFVLIQETHLTFHARPVVERRLKILGWTMLVSITPSGHGGTAIVYRTRLETDGTLHRPGGPAAVRHADDGRHIAAPFNWGGHALLIASIYLPSGNPTAQRAYIADQLRPLYDAAGASGRRLLWGGDYNFAPEPHLDRLRHPPGAPHPDIGTQRRWSEALPDLVDVWRRRHPARRGYTFIRSTAASRLDRFYASPELLSYIAICAIRDRALSDHRPVSLVLTASDPADIGPGRRRVRLGFIGSPDLRRQMQDWLREHTTPAPDDHLALLVWWRQFKRSLAAKCGELHRASRNLSAEAEAAATQLAALTARVDEGDDAALPAAVAARQRFCEAATACEAEAALQRRQTWLHRGERPCPALTRRLRPPLRGRQVPALRSANGQLLERGSACAQRVAEYWAQISAQPTTDPAAQQEVLAALGSGSRLTAQQAEQLGSPQVLEAEILRALRTAPPGRSPGHDGIPVELYRTFKSTFAPLLARLFTAVATTGQLPARFHEGLITTIHKRGDRSDPGNYRPITLLCTDYRLYAKALALRLNPCLPDIIDREQTAFIPGRRIGENILTLQCLSELLRRQGRSAIAAMCDFRKAYDTIARPFLYAAMDTVGVGPGFLALVRTLLTGTAARAYVNGWTSTPAPTAAGVRQGCPLAPLLYLFVAQALLRLLKARGIGIDVAGLRLTAPQYADDTEPLLPSLDQVPALLDALTTFGAASGQHLNPGKTLLLPLGAVPPDLPADAHGLRVVNTATALGVAFGSAADPAADWPQLVEGVERCFTRISNLPHAFSAFGRGFAASAYGVSKFLYHAEFTGQPPPQHLAHLTSITARLIDRRLPPAGGPPRFAGLAAWLLPGRPAEGGFGALPWPEHITSRHAWWAIRLITEPVSTPWVAVARALLRTCAAEVGSHPLGLLLWPADAPIPGRAALLPEPLRRLHTAVRCLPRVTDIAPQPLQPGPWCLAAPLWGNAFFASPDHPDSIDLAFSDVADIGIHTIGQLLSARAVVAAVMGSAAAYHPVWQTLLRHYAPYLDRHYAAHRLAQLEAALPAAWVAAASLAAAAVAVGQLPAPTHHDALAVLLPRLGWQRDPASPVTLFNYTVRSGTDIITTPARRRRSGERLRPFAEQQGGTLQELQHTLVALWRLPWENRRKEPYWRLVYNAFPTAVRMHLPDTHCICGAAHADAQHHFSECPPAAAVLASISAALAGARPGAAPATRADLWLARPPPAVHAGTWQVVCLAAIAAMDGGRRYMYARLHGPAQPPPYVPDIIAGSTRFAVARFWLLLGDFVGLGRVPRRWCTACPPGHPFISYHPGSHRWTVDRPAVGPATPQQ